MSTIAASYVGWSQENHRDLSGSVVARIFSALVLVGCSLSGRVRHMQILVSATVTFASVHSRGCLSPQSYF
ncbi:hypothetical protein PILCRDRAFT_830046 [Piloderma croceum F 1598]|uniref:Uncharacterized protein n=1 Tax=Piloderma croceum (strain F 1598) TaxID=765440 RepID=A0A0C3B3W0_PILCF|nr:hypothetical protein PILCRDRAFT_830046 [Piloderma croceum F 1598]